MAFRSSPPIKKGDGNEVFIRIFPSESTSNSQNQSVAHQKRLLKSRGKHKDDTMSKERREMLGKRTVSSMLISDRSTSCNNRKILSFKKNQCCATKVYQSELQNLNGSARYSVVRIYRLSLFCFYYTDIYSAFSQQQHREVRTLQAFLTERRELMKFLKFLK